MARWRAVLGLVMGAFLLVSGVAHIFLGGAEMTTEMTRAQVPEDLARGLTIGWNFGGAAMLVFGAIVIAVFRRGFRGEEVSTTPVLLIAGGYLVFGVWSLGPVTSGPSSWSL